MAALQRAFGSEGTVALSVRKGKPRSTSCSLHLADHMASSGTLITSISGIRGIFGDGLDPQALVRYGSAFGTWIRTRAATAGRPPTVVVGRDGRVTGPLCSRLVIGALQASGCDVVDIGLAATPTVEIAVLAEEAMGGIVLSASHNPAEWNALKLLNEKGQFLDAGQGQAVLDLAAEGTPPPVAFDAVGSVRSAHYLPYHVEQVVGLDFIQPEAIAAQAFTVLVDGINSVGALAMPALLRALGIDDDHIHLVNGTIHGRFSHPAEPLPAHLTETMAQVKAVGADLGLVVDPDADRLALIDETGTYVSEELTQVLAADFLWRRRSGSFVTNLSSSRAIEDVAARYNESVFRSAVGEINVVKKMEAVSAMLGGEGNGGVILPDLHLGRDALIGAAMILQHLAEQQQPLSAVVAALPQFSISKNKIPLGEQAPTPVLEALATRYADERVSTMDGVKIDFAEGWVHVRPSNTEPVLRIYAEAPTADAATALAERFVDELTTLRAGNA